MTEAVQANQLQDNLPPVLDGHMRNAKGHLVPITMIKPIDMLRDQTVTRIVQNAKNLAAINAQFKRQAFEDVAAFVEASAEQFDVHVGGDKGGVTLISFDGRYKVERSFAGLIRLDEQVLAAKALLDECVEDWKDDSRDELKVVLTEIFATGSGGQLVTSKVLSLLRWNIRDPRWLKAMDVIREAIQVTDTKPFLRIYERSGPDGKFVQIPLDVTKL